MFNADSNKQLIKKQLLQLAFFNLFIVAILGLLMRAIPLLNSFPLEFGNVLHGHSHFAFGGWILPILVWMIMQFFPQLENKISFTHWRNIIMLVLFSAYGMLVTFPFQGYAAGSIFFSTISVFAGFYLAIIIWRACIGLPQKVSLLLLKAGLFFLVLSSIGPFATGPLAAMGKAGTPIYYNAIYFYLHFQYNGFFSFVIFAVICTVLDKKDVLKNGKLFYVLSTMACLFTFFLSALWSKPSTLIYILGGLGGVLQIASFYFLWKDVKRLATDLTFMPTVFELGFVALLLKSALQLLSALPVVTQTALENRNYIVAYLHLVLLGFITMFAFGLVMHTHRDLITSRFKTGVILFIVSFISTQLLLVMQPTFSLWTFESHLFPYLIFAASMPFPVSIILMVVSVRQLFSRDKQHICQQIIS